MKFRLLDQVWFRGVLVLGAMVVLVSYLLSIQRRGEVWGPAPREIDVNEVIDEPLSGPLNDPLSISFYAPPSHLSDEPLSLPTSVKVELSPLSEPLSSADSL